MSYNICTYSDADDASDNFGATATLQHFFLGFFKYAILLKAALVKINIFMQIYFSNRFSSELSYHQATC